MVARHARRRSRRSGAAALAIIVLTGGSVVGFAWSRHAHVPATTTTTSTTSTTTTTTTTSPPTFTLSAVGDTDLGNTPNLPANPAAEFAPVKALLRADIVFGNLEGTMTTGGYSKCAVASDSCYAFKVPPAYAAVYRAAGFTVLNSANNHSYDFGAEGVAQTSAALRRVGIVQAGLPGQIGLVHVHGMGVAFVDVAPYGLTNNMLDLGAVDALLTRARAEAQVVVVYMHSGAEGVSADHVTRRSEFFYGENRGNPYEFAHYVIDHGADLVLASGPHVLRGLQWYRGRLIAYSLGDFTNYNAFASVGDLSLSAILHLTLTAHGQVVSGYVVPIRIVQGGLAEPDPTHATWAFLNELSREDFGASAALVSSTGVLER